MLVWPSKDKDGVVKQDWDEYIVHGLNNKHWVLEKFKWSNPFYTPKLSAKICNEGYRRHILSSKHLQGSLKELVGKRLGCLCPNLDECHGNVLIEFVHEFFPSESEMRGYILCHQYLFFKGQRSPLSNYYVHNIKMQDGTFVNVHQMYCWKKAIALGERFVAKNILEERDPTKIFKLLKTLPSRNVPHPKDKVDPSLKKDIVYQWSCTKPNCKSSYIGETSRSLCEWVKEHSKEGSNSAIYQHCSTKGHPPPNIDQFKVIDQEKSQIAREAKEAIHIRKLDPELNRNVGKMVIPHVFDSLLGIKPKNPCVASLLSQEVGSQNIGINLTQFHSCVDKRVNHCSNRAQRARNFISN